MLQIIGPATQATLRPAVAERILANFPKNHLGAVRREPGRIILPADATAVAIDGARNSYRCRDARKELRRMRADTDQALTHAFNQSMSIAGDEALVADLFAKLTLS